MIETPGGSNSAGHGNSGSSFQFNLLRSLIVDPLEGATDDLVSLAHSRGYDVTVADGWDIDAELGKDPVELLMVRLVPEFRQEIEQLVRRLLRLFRADGMVVMGIIDASKDEELLAEWLKLGIDGFIRSDSLEMMDAQLLAAEHRVAQRRGRMAAQKEVTASLRQYETYFLNAPVAQLIVSKRDHRVIDGSLLVQDVLGWRREELIGRYLSLVFPDLFRKGVIEEACGTVDENGSPVMLDGVSHRKPDGKQSFMQVKVSTVPWDNKEAVALVFADVSNALAREEKRIRSAKMDTVKVFAGGIADDMSNLVTAVRGNLALLGKHADNGGDVRGMIEDAGNACGSAEKMIERLRMLVQCSASSSDSGLKRQRLSIAAFLERVVSFELLGSEVIPSFACEENLWETLADERELEQALQAIVANARDAMPTGGSLNVASKNCRVAMRSETTEPFVLIELNDDGEGVPRDLLPRIFDPYFTGRPDRDGMGLAICQAIVRCHGGAVDLDSTPGKGTSVRILLPALLPREKQECGFDQVVDETTSGRKKTDSHHG